MISIRYILINIKVKNCLFKVLLLFEIFIFLYNYYFQKKINLQNLISYITNIYFYLSISKFFFLAIGDYYTK